MKPLIIPIFIVYKGCPNRCLYCNERITAGNHPDKITERQFRETVDGYLKSASKKWDRIEIAFYGGNFTGMDLDYQIELLSLANSYIKDGPVQSIRISTRPDYIDETRIGLLKKYGVTTVEIGAQSMVDDVLKRSRRGHSSDDVRSSVKILKKSGFETGVHLMAGLPGDTPTRFMYTVEEIVRLKPDTARIHPTLVLKDTLLEDAYVKGNYRPLSLNEAVSLCAHALSQLRGADISVIRLGLHTTEEMGTDGSIVAGPFHPAFGALVEGSLFLDMASHLIRLSKRSDKGITFSVSPKDVSRLRGLKNDNLVKLKDLFHVAKIRIIEDPLQEKESLVLIADGGTYKTDIKSCHANKEAMFRNNLN